MNGELFSAFCTYLTTARELLGPSAPPPRTGEALTLVRDSDERLRKLVRDLEDRPEFTRLVELTRGNLAGPYHSAGQTGWSFAISDFFVRSGLYIDISKGRDVPEHEAFQAYLSEFQKTRVRLTTLVAIENVSFASDSIDCGTFQIKHFTQEEMTALVCPEVREVFFPSDVLGCDLTELGAFWYVQLEEEPPADRLGVDGPRVLRPDVFGSGKPLPTDSYEWIPAQLNPLLEHLSLFDWQPTEWKELDSGTTRDPGHEEDCAWCRRHSDKPHKKPIHEPVWKGLRPAFVLRCSDKWLSWRFLGYTLPDMDQFDCLEWVDEEETGETKLELYGDIHLDEAGTKEFAEFVRETGRLLPALRSRTQEYSWGFLDRALQLLAHGSLSDGYEQLLQHVNVVETLLGGEERGLSGRLGKRVASLLGDTKAQRKKLKEEFEVVYGVRSKLVHGEQLPATGLEGHIRSARRFARESCLWFVRFLSEVLGHEEEGRHLDWAPTREDFLAAIDTGRTTRARLAKLFEEMQDNLPA